MGHWMRHAADFPAFDLIKSDDTVVDVGCGVGGACVAAGLAGAEVIAIDMDPTLINHVTNRMKDVPARSYRGLVSDCDPIPLPDSIASYVICTEVMEHVDNPCRFAHELNRIGKPGATYIISVPDPASETLMETVVDPSYFERPNHQRVYSHGDFDALLRAAGIDVLDRPRTPNNFYWAMWCVFRWSSSLGGKPEPNLVPPLVYRWNEVWAALQEAPGGERVIERLDRAIPRSQVVIARKSDRLVDLPAIEATWQGLVQAQVEAKARLAAKLLEAKDAPRASAAHDQPPAPHFAKRWRGFVKEGKVKLGKINLAWSISRHDPDAVHQV
jgi:SAM-dependent methyltransferase